MYEGFLKMTVLLRCMEGSEIAHTMYIIHRQNKHINDVFTVHVTI